MINFINLDECTFYLPSFRNTLYTSNLKNECHSIHIFYPSPIAIIIFE